MFGLSGTELIIVVVLALILIGPDELPAAARTVAKALRDVRKAGDDLRDTFEREVMTDVRKAIEPPTGTVAKTKAPPAPAAEENAEPPAPVPSVILPPPAPEPKIDTAIPVPSQGKWAVSAAMPAQPARDTTKPEGSA